MEKAMGEKKRYKIGVKGDPSGGAGKTTNPAGFIQNSDLIYLNPDRKRTENWMQSVGLQLPSDATAFGSIGTITYPNGEVKIEGIPYKQHMKPGGQQERYSIKDTEIAAVQNIRRKSLNAFTPEELAATEGFARQYWREMGVKSPFFRSWFGDWRANDTTPVQVAQAEGDTGCSDNEDTGWEINVSGKVFSETKAHQGTLSKAAMQYLPYINDIVKKAVLLDSYTMGDKAKSGNSLLMHSLYAVADIGKGAEVLKLYVEEMNDPNRAGTAKRAYQLQNIENQQLSAKGSGNALAQSVSTADVKTIADLFKIVKVKDKNFTPKPASKVMDASGQPMVVYHGTDDTLYEFQYEEIRSREGSFFFTQNKEDAESYSGSGNVIPVYVNLQNPIDYNNMPSEIYKLKDKHEQVEALKQLGYDGWVADMESGWAEISAFYPEQIKSAYDNIGTFDPQTPDIRHALREKSSLRAEEVKARMQEMVEQYGTIPSGERPFRQVQVPKQTAEGRKVSQTVRTAMEAEATPDMAIPNIEALVAQGDFSYEVATDQAAIEKAVQIIGGKGWETALKDWTVDVRSGKISKDNTAMGWALYNNAANSGNTRQAVEILSDMVYHQRSAAQAVQATRILKKLSPKGQLYGIQRSVENLQEELKDRYGTKAPELSINEKLVEQVLNGEPREARDEIYEDAIFATSATTDAKSVSG